MRYRRPCMEQKPEKKKHHWQRTKMKNLSLIDFSLPTGTKIFISTIIISLQITKTILCSFQQRKNSAQTCLCWRQQADQECLVNVRISPLLYFGVSILPFSGAQSTLTPWLCQRRIFISWKCWHRSSHLSSASVNLSRHFPGLTRSKKI